MISLFRPGLLPPGTTTWSRRELLGLFARSAGAAALAPSMVSLLSEHLLAQEHARRSSAPRLILLWLEGGPSQLETFDPKPGTPTGGPTRGIATDAKGWLFAEALPGLARRAADLAVIRSMTSKEGNHSRARMLVQCGYVPTPTVSFPSLGSIVAHELGDVQHELPAFVQVNGAPIGAGHLGVTSSPFVVNNPTGRIENLAPARDVNARRLDHRGSMVDLLDEEFTKRGGGPAVESNRAQRARARRLMDSRLLTAFDLEQEKEGVRDAYGRGDFGQGVLLARRLLEHGVQAVQVVLNGWDTHQDNFGRTTALGGQLDAAFSALIDDLKRRDLFGETVVVCMGEFGRTPEIAAGDGRNHWPGNWCVALAGGRIRGGTVVGATDELGQKIVERPVQVADLFATLAAALTLDRDREYLAGKRPVKLIDPDGRVVRDLLA